MILWHSYGVHAHDRYYTSVRDQNKRDIEVASFVGHSVSVSVVRLMDPCSIEFIAMVGSNGSEGLEVLFGPSMVNVLMVSMLLR